MYLLALKVVVIAWLAKGVEGFRNFHAVGSEIMIRKSSESNSRLCHRQPAIRGSTVLSCNTLLHQQLLLASEVDLDALQRSITSQDYSQTSTISNALIVTAALAWFVYDLRPRGSCREDLIDVQKSKVIRNQLGVVARKFVPKGTVVGSYPGYRKSLRRFAAGSKSTAVVCILFY